MCEFLNTIFYFWKDYSRKILPSFFFKDREDLYISVDNKEKWDTLELEILKLINKYRVEKGLNKLIHNRDLWEVSNARAFHYKMLGTLDDHIGFSKVSIMLEELGIKYPGEAIYRGYPVAEPIVQAWINSPTHNSILLSSTAKYVGVGIAKRKNHIFYCMIKGG